MDENINQDLREKPNHAHYPICRGRLDEIQSHSRRLLYCTLVVFLLMAFFSFLCVPLHVVGWIPMLFNTEEISKGAFHTSLGFGMSEVFFCAAIIFIAFLNCGKRKVFGIVMLVIYAVLLLASLLVYLSPFDYITTFMSALGLYFSRSVFKDKRDYEQLSKTEGFPMFSVILAEYDDQKEQQPFIRTQSGKDYYNKASQQGSAPAAPTVQSYANPNSGLGNMPEIGVAASARQTARSGRFEPKPEKEGTLLFSPMKLK